MALIILLKSWAIPPDQLPDGAHFLRLGELHFDFGAFIFRQLSLKFRACPGDKNGQQRIDKIQVLQGTVVDKAQYADRLCLGIA